MMVNFLQSFPLSSGNWVSSACSRGQNPVVGVPLPRTHTETALWKEALVSLGSKLSLWGGAAGGQESFDSGGFPLPFSAGWQ